MKMLGELCKGLSFSVLLEEEAILFILSLYIIEIKNLSNQIYLAGLSYNEGFYNLSST